MKNEEFKTLAELLIESLPAQSLPELIGLSEREAGAVVPAANQVVEAATSSPAALRAAEIAAPGRLKTSGAFERQASAAETPTAPVADIKVDTPREKKSANTEITRLGVQLQALQKVAIENRPVAPPKPKAAEKTASSGSSIGSTLLKTVGYTTGLGPVISGILSLFGSGSKKFVPDPIPYVAPQSLNVSGGLNAQRNFTEISYAQNGLARSNTASPQANTPARVEVHVQAIDSRSFIDHSDAIAQAVQSAMLQSHSLNDVVSEI